MERVLNQLIEKLKKAHGDILVSTVLYGSAATGDYQGGFSDFNILCVLRQVTPSELQHSEPIFRWWRELGNPSPLLMSTEEVRTSTDSFPIEFYDIKARHRILYGEDVVANLDIHFDHHRAQVEHELRAKVLRLRQKAAGVLSDKALLLQLMADSISTFCTLFRHVLLLAGEEPRWQKRDVVAAAAGRFGFDPDPFYTLLDLRDEKRKARHIDPVPLLDTYLRQLVIVVEAVDSLER